MIKFLKKPDGSPLVGRVHFTFPNIQFTNKDIIEIGKGFCLVKDPFNASSIIFLPHNLISVEPSDNQSTALNAPCSNITLRKALTSMLNHEVKLTYTNGTTDTPMKLVSIGKNFIQIDDGHSLHAYTVFLNGLYAITLASADEINRKKTYYTDTHPLPKYISINKLFNGLVMQNCLIRSGDNVFINGQITGTNEDNTIIYITDNNGKTTNVIVENILWITRR